MINDGKIIMIRVVILLTPYIINSLKLHFGRVLSGQIVVSELTYPAFNPTKLELKQIRSRLGKITNHDLTTHPLDN